MFNFVVYFSCQEKLSSWL